MNTIKVILIVSEMTWPEYNHCCVVPDLLEDRGPGVDDEEVRGQGVERDVDEVVGAGAAAGQGVVQPEGEILLIGRMLNIENRLIECV